MQHCVFAYDTYVHRIDSRIRIHSSQPLYLDPAINVFQHMHGMRSKRSIIRLVSTSGFPKEYRMFKDKDKDKRTSASKGKTVTKKKRTSNTAYHTVIATEGFWGRGCI